ncbi:LysR substrate-binding domain-containing protein [Haloferula sp. A504]|uniref:LysR substrate-binding domain-containing protein n=1 Tax=Haloferula sp. A504 TaxID=3373601 RepID=UPI0031C33DDE|nr:LysR substrate-binding domain-containing protein [Verrucomicrobiaceae bacterium E54]
MKEEFVGRKGVSLERFRTLCAVAEAGGVMNAAGGDPNRQSLYSRQLKELEQGLGLGLLDRSSSPNRLTTTGAEVERAARTFLGEIGRLLEIDAGREPVVGIGAGESIIQWLLLPRLAPRAGLGGVMLRFHNLKARVAEERVRSRRLDLAVVGVADSPADLEAETLGHYGMVLVASKGLLKRGKIRLERLAGMRLAVLEGSGRVRRRLAELEAGGGPTVGLECTSYPQVIEACLEGGFVGIVPKIVRTASLPPDLEIREVPELAEITTDLTMLWHPAAYEDRAELRKVIGWLRGKR